MGPGRYEYLADFYKSLNKGPVKLELGAQAPVLSAADKQKAEEQDRAFALMQRSMVLGTLFAFAGGAVAWWVTKKVLGVRDIAEFAGRMKEMAPKVVCSLRLPRGLRTQTWTSALPVSIRWATTSPSAPGI